MLNPFEKTSNYFNNLGVKIFGVKKLKMERDKSCFTNKIISNEKIDSC